MIDEQSSASGHDYASGRSAMGLATDELCFLLERYYTELLNEQPSEATRYDSTHYQHVKDTVEHHTSTFNTSRDITGTLVSDFTINEVAKICQRLPNNKALEYDGISNECLKHGGYMLFETLTVLFNDIVRTGCIPPSLKHSVIIPLYKGKNRPKNSMNSYRGASLTPTLNKVLEKLVMDRLKPWDIHHSGC